MRNIHVSGSLDQDQRIFRYISFYGLIDLLTFSQISFSDQLELSERDTHGKIFYREKPMCESIAHQSWSLLEQEAAIDWHAADRSEPSICIVSSIRALSASLFVDDATNVFIERTYRAIHGPVSSKLGLTNTVPVFQDEFVSVIVKSADSPADTGHKRSGRRVLVDLKTLLAGVIVSPDASIRFLELAAKLVQQTTCAFVSRASRQI